MIVREVLEEEKEAFNTQALHPLQSWEWGEFREKTGLKVVRLGVFDEKKLVSGYQLTVHPVPRTNYSVIYFPKGPMPDKTMLNALAKLGKQENAILVKMEPLVGGPINEDSRISGYEDIKKFLLANGCRPGKPLFPKYTFWLDLTKKEEDLLAIMHPKTRYNVRLAQKHGVEVIEDNSPETFQTHLKLLFETTERQGFYAHNKDYHQKMWQTLNPAGIAHLLVAKYKEKPLVTWILFAFNKVLYYPYGGSTREHKEVMPSYAIMWEAVKFGKKMGCKTFDLWGTPGPDPKPSDPWFGFHRFKVGFGPKLVEFIGTYDLVLNPYLYPLYNLADDLRWKFLRAKARLPI